MSQTPRLPPLAALEKTAATLLVQVGKADPDALDAVRTLHPRGADALRGFAVSDARLIVARQHGAPSWPRLKRDIAVHDDYAWDPPDDPAEGVPGAPVGDALIRLATVTYGSWRPEHAVAARALLAAQPELAVANIYTAATVGDVAEVERLLAARPSLATVRGGPYRWEPLLYACYSRLESGDPGHDTLEVARRLLAAGADPNAGFLWGGNSPPFTALTAAFGLGEDPSSQPPHPRAEELARALLEAGADPNDGQTLYNRHFGADDAHFVLLFAFGLGTDKAGPWFGRLGDRLPAPERMLEEELWFAARAGFEGRVQLLLERGVDPNRAGVRDGRTPWQVATLAGNVAVVARLEAAGARPIALSAVEQFVVASVSGDAAVARARYDAVSAALDEAARVVIVHRAVEAGKVAAIPILAALGFPLSGSTTHDGAGANLTVTPLHNAAWAGNLDMVQALVSAGADVRATDPAYGATPAGWAAHNGQHAVAAWLRGVADH